MGKLWFASALTIGMLCSFVFCIVMVVLIYTNSIDLTFAIGLTIVINVVLWVIGPSLTDFINRWVYKVEFIPQDKVEALYPDMAKIILEVTKEYNFPFPKIGIIPDNNPTAFTYGTGRYNARLIVTAGIFHFLNPDEVRAVVAHELGHIVNRDFMVMMVASTLVQILYEIYARLIRVRGKRTGAIKLIALASYALYIVGIYLVYYLSRTREYLADEFSAKKTDPKHLADALIKIAYGIVMAEDDDSSKRLLQSTRHLGIVDVKNAKHVGVISYITQKDPNSIAETMVFDKVNPWARIIELNSTHPLTGNRIDRLSDISKLMGRAFSFDIDGAIARLKIDKTRLFNNFRNDIVIYFLPLILMIPAVLFFPLYVWIGAIAVGLLLQIPYQFPQGATRKTTVLELMRNPYASPMRGEVVELSGEAIGRGVPGYIFSEDMMYKDPTGLIFLDYTSKFGFIGNWFFALTKVTKLFSVPSTATGWFYRDIGSHMKLKQIKTEQETIKSHPILWKAIQAGLLLLLACYLGR